MNLFLKSVCILIIVNVCLSTAQNPTTQASVDYHTRHPAADNQFPYMVYIYMKLEDIYETFLCGGVILDKNHVLTSASCFVSRPTDEVEIDYIYIYAGSNAQPNTTYTYRIINYDIMKNYSSTGYINDLIMLKISPDFVFSSQISPITVGDSWSDVSGICALPTWFDGMDWDYLYWCNIGQFDCARTNSLLYCAGDPTQQTAVTTPDDVGGAMVCNNKLVGLVTMNKDSQYLTNITEHYNQIQEYLGRIITTISPLSVPTTGAGTTVSGASPPTTATSEPTTGTGTTVPGTSPSATETAEPTTGAGTTDLGSSPPTTATVEPTTGTGTTLLGTSLPTTATAEPTTEAGTTVPGTSPSTTATGEPTTGTGTTVPGTSPPATETAEPTTEAGTTVPGTSPPTTATAEPTTGAGTTVPGTSPPTTATGEPTTVTRTTVPGTSPATETAEPTTGAETTVPGTSPPTTATGEPTTGTGTTVPGTLPPATETAEPITEAGTTVPETSPPTTATLESNTTKGTSPATTFPPQVTTSPASATTQGHSSAGFNIIINYYILISAIFIVTTNSIVHATII